MMLPVTSPLKACQCVVYTEEESDSTGLILQAEKARVINGSHYSLDWTGYWTGLHAKLWL